MICRIEIPTNEQIYGRFYRWKLLHQGGSGGKFNLLGIPLVLLLGAVLLWTTGNNLLFAAVLVALAVGYTVYTMVLRPGAEFRKKEGAALQTELYIFTETSFTRSVRSEESGMQDTSSGQYNLFISAVETKEDFYLFTSPSQAYLLDKEYFTKGSPEEMRATLRAKLGDKFKTTEKIGA